MSKKSDRENFEMFLSSVNLKKYRENFSSIKIVEMDLDRNIQAISLLYQVYWQERNFLSFEEFYSRYLKEKSKNLETFRTKIQMCEKCFYKGLPARIYRTWASIITQIQAAYVAEDLFGANSVQMSEELDHKGADIRITYKKQIFNCQVKKESQRIEARIERKSKSKLDGKWIYIGYFVPNKDDLEKPKKLNGEFKEPYKRFISDKRLKYLSNGFVIFTNNLFLKLKKQIDSN